MGILKFKENLKNYCIIFLKEIHILFENNCVFPKGDNKNLSQNIIIMQFTYVY